MEPPEALDAFVSYRSADREAVWELATELRALGVELWLFEEETAGQDWERQLGKAISAARCALVAVGRDGVSEVQQNEIGMALALHLTVIPVVLRDAGDPPQIPELLRRRGWVDCRRGLSDQKIDELYRGITGRDPAPSWLRHLERADRELEMPTPDMDSLRREWRTGLELSRDVGKVGSARDRIVTMVTEHERQWRRSRVSAGVRVAVSILECACELDPRWLQLRALLVYALVYEAVLRLQEGDRARRKPTALLDQAAVMVPRLAPDLVAEYAIGVRCVQKVFAYLSSVESRRSPHAESSRATKRRVYGRLGQLQELSQFDRSDEVRTTLLLLCRVQGIQVEEHQLVLDFESQPFAVPSMNIIHVVETVKRISHDQAAQRISFKQVMGDERLRALSRDLLRIQPASEDLVFEEYNEVESKLASQDLLDLLFRDLPEFESEPASRNLLDLLFKDFPEFKEFTEEQRVLLNNAAFTSPRDLARGTIRPTRPAPGVVDLEFGLVRSGEDLVLHAGGGMGPRRIRRGAARLVAAARASGAFGRDRGRKEPTSAAEMRRVFRGVLSRGPADRLLEEAQSKADEEERPLRIRLTTSPSLEWLPFESLASPASGGQGPSPWRQAHIVRGVSARPTAAAAAARSGPLRVCVVGACPYERERARFERELRELRASLAARSDVELVTSWGKGTRDRLLRPSNSVVELLLFVGWSSFDRRRHDHRLLFEDGAGGIEPIYAQDIGSVLTAFSTVQAIGLWLGTKDRPREPPPWSGFVRATLDVGARGLALAPRRGDRSTCGRFWPALAGELARGSVFEVAARGAWRKAVEAGGGPPPVAPPVLFTRMEAGRSFRLRPGGAARRDSQGGGP